MTIWQRLYRLKAHHVLLWLCYYGFFYGIYAQYYQSTWLLLGIISIYFVFNAGAFYVTTYYLFPKFLQSGKYILFFVLSLSTLVVLSLGLTYSLRFTFTTWMPQYAEQYPIFFQFAFLSVVTMTGLLAGLKLIVDKIRQDRKNRELDKQRLEGELQYLKAQVNPHFLFNTINSVYFLIRKDQDKAAETLIKLSDLLRYQLYDCSADMIAVEKEIAYLDNYIALERVRRGDKVKVSINNEGVLTGFMLAPFMLIPFIENAFKHVSTTLATGNWINISLRKEGSSFVLEVSNSKESADCDEVGGIGLKNVRRRLELLYPKKHTLEMKDESVTYRVRLSLEIE